MMDRRKDLLPATELALLVVTATAVSGMDRLFTDGSFRPPLLLQVILAHVVIAGLRRANLRLSTAWGLSVVAAILAIAWTQYAGMLWILLPSPETLSAVLADMDHAWFVFSDVRAPAAVEPGFIAATSIVIWLVAFVADWAAFRIGLSFESLLPSVALFLFAVVIALLGGEGGVGAGAALYAAAALVFLLLQRTARQESAATWTLSERRLGRRSLLGTGAVLTVAAIGVGGLGGPVVLGADQDPIWDWRGVGDDEDTRVVVSPLVDVRGRLVDNSDVEVFTVRTDDRSGSYWRLTALDSFDGTIWRSSYETDAADDDLPRTIGEKTDVRRVTQEISVSALAQIWLPAAYQPVALETGAATPVDYDEESSTLIVDQSIDSADGMTYTVVSDVPQWTDEQLRGAADDVPDGIADRYLQLPEDLDPAIREEARRITEGADTTYDRAMALQTYLRTFRYSLEPPSGHDEDALVEFLYETREGYCEQFAGAFAAMARSLGIPTRVAVGFTQGVEDPNEPGLFRVQGKHAHAWTEVWFEGYGWVPFEPTPARGGPSGAQEWLGIQPRQAGDGGRPSTGASQGQAPAVSEDPGEGPEGPDEVADPVPAPDAPGAATGNGDDAAEGSGSGIAGRILAAARTAALVGVAYLLLVPAALAIQRHLRRRHAARPAQEVLVAWEEILEQASLCGLRMAPSMTIKERAERLRTKLPGAGTAVDDIAGLLERDLYAGSEPDHDDVGMAWEAASTVAAEVARQRPWYRRATDHLDARRLAVRPGRHRRAAHDAPRSWITHQPASAGWDAHA